MFIRNTPELLVADVDEEVRYYTEVQGLTLNGRVPEDTSQPAEWASVGAGDVGFMFERAAEPKAPGSVVFYIGVGDIAAAERSLRERGACIVDGPNDTWYGMRELTVADPAGHRLVFNCPIAAPVKS